MSRSRGDVVRLRSVVCVREGAPVLAGADLSVAAGEVVLISGDNGTGKSTLLRVVAGLLPFLSGDASVLGQALPERAQAVRASVALVGHDSLCYDDLPVRANLRFHSRAAGRPQAAADEWMVRAGLADVADRPHGRLSAGQRKRCALAVGLLRDAPVLLLDEPFVSLDADGRLLVEQAVSGARRRGAAVLLVSHELDDVRALADREMRLERGILDQV